MKQDGAPKKPKTNLKALKNDSLALISGIVDTV